MIVLTAAQAGDLRYLVALFRITVGLTRERHARGDSIRTGRALARKGLVQPAAAQFSNRVTTWVPTHAGIAYVELNFARFDRFASVAVHRVGRHLSQELR